PLYQTFTYAVEEEPENPLLPGSRAVVPLRRARAIGICLGESDGKGVRSPRAIIDVPDPAPALDESMLALCRWISDYYVVPIGLVVRCVLPALLTGVSSPRPTPKTRRVAVLSMELPSLQERDELFARAKRQRELYEVIE